MDCPGHATLIRTVIGGAQIIDMMLLVVDITKGIQVRSPCHAECCRSAAATTVSCLQNDHTSTLLEALCVKCRWEVLVPTPFTW